MNYRIALTALLAILSLLSCSQEDPAIETLTIASLGSDTLYTGREYHLSVTSTPRVESPRLSWSVSDASIASIQYGGVLKPLRKGELTVLVTSLQSGGKSVRASRHFTLISSGVYLRDRSITINPLETYTLPYRFLPEDYKPTEALSWSVADPSIASVDSEGRVRGLTDGETTVYVRLGNLLSGFFSEDSVAVTVRHHTAPTYTYTDGVLELTQKVPGLLPMVAKEMPYFSKIIVHGPINGSDLLFFSEQNARIDALDLSDTRIVSGGRTVLPKKRFFSDPEPTAVGVTDDTLPRAFASGLTIKQLTLPRGIRGLIDFGLNFIYTSLTFPEGYEELQLGEFATTRLQLPGSLKRLYCDQPKLFEEQNGGPNDLKISSVEEELLLPKGLEELRALLELSSPLTLPRSLKAVTLTGRFDDITFAGPSAITTLSSTFFIQHPNQDKGPLSTIQAKTLRLPEGLETLGARALAAGAYGYFISNQQIDLRTALHIKQLLLPSTLRSIGEAAFFSAQIQEPVRLPQRLRTIGPLAFYASSLPEITLPESLQRIDDQAFALCGSLETVRALGKIPPILGSMAFFRTTKQGRIERLIVPQGCKSAYVQAGYAPFFFDIVEATH